MSKLLFLTLILTITIATSSGCAQKAGCPGVKKYTSDSKSTKKVKKKDGASPWSKKYKKKNKKRAQHRLFK